MPRHEADEEADPDARPPVATTDRHGFTPTELWVVLLLLVVALAIALPVWLTR